MLYIIRILQIAFRKTLVRTDVIAAVLTVIAPAVYFTLGTKMPETFGVQLAFLVAALVLAVIFLRLLMAPFIIWKEDQEKIRSLENAVSDPQRRRRTFFEDRFLEDRAKFAKELVPYSIIEIDPIAFAEFDPNTHINSLALNAAPFLGDMRFRTYWDVFCMAFRNLVAGGRFKREHGNNLTPMHTGKLNDRLAYDLAATKVAATSLVFILTENIEHERVFNESLTDLNSRFTHVCEDGCPASLWIPPEPLLPGNTAKEMPQ